MYHDACLSCKTSIMIKLVQNVLISHCDIYLPYGTLRLWLGYP